jgi:hypothetical protein
MKDRRDDFVALAGVSAFLLTALTVPVQPKNSGTELALSTLSRKGE